MLRNWKVTVQYDGTDYWGWQVQPEHLSVQEEIQRVLSKVYAAPCAIQGSGRTDSGVHALGQVFSFYEPRRISLTPERFVKALNALLPPAIRILRAEEAAEDFHARFGALGKTYIYLIENSERAIPFWRHYSWNRRYSMDLDAAGRVMAQLQGEHDFSAFTVKNQELKGPAVRTIFKTEVERWQGMTLLRFTGSGFLYKMVRSLTGQVVETACGLSDESKTAALLENGCRLKAAQVAPPQGLYLAEVYYEEDKLERALTRSAAEIFQEGFFF
jgi:tRNA pseudouridine38-40 synthase